MDKSVSAADANRKFSELLRSVRDGASYVVTTHGRPVAKIVPVRKDDKVTETARQQLLARLNRERVLNRRRWKRDELYEELF